jgi:hypothetical protein
MTELRGLTIRQPWAGLIAIGAKPVENRTWSTGYRGEVALHAAGREDEHGWSNPLVGPTLMGQVTPDNAHLVMALGAVVAVAALAGICSRTVPGRAPAGQPSCDCGLWAVSGQHHWGLTNVRPLTEAVEVPGRLGLWTPEPALAERILAGVADG